MSNHTKLNKKSRLIFTYIMPPVLPIEEATMIRSKISLLYLDSMLLTMIIVINSSRLNWMITMNSQTLYQMRNSKLNCSNVLS